MTPTTYQTPEIRDSNDNIIKQGSFGKNTALANSTNDGWIDYVANDLEFLYDLAKDEVVPVPSLPASGQTNKTYLLTTTGVSYRWSGTEWVAVSSSEAVGRAESAANLAEQWATKTDGTVDGTEYSAKYYAEQAEASADDAQDVADDMADHLVQIDKNTGGVSKNSKRISNIEKLLQGNLYDYDTDDDSAYTKTVPSGALPYAGIEQIGGKTVVWNQLQKNTLSRTSGGVVFTFDSTDGSLTLSEETAGATRTSTAYWFPNESQYKYELTGRHKYYSKTVNTHTGVQWFLQGYAVNSIITYSSTTMGNMYCSVSPSADLSTPVKFYPQVFDLTLMYGSGNEPSTVAEFEAMFPASYYPYNAGTLLSAGVTGVKSVGKNLLNTQRTVEISYGYTDSSSKRNLAENQVWKGFAYSGYTNNTTITSYSLGNGTFTYKSTTNGYGIGFPIKVKPNTKYTFQCVKGIASGMYGVQFNTDGYMVTFTSNKSADSFTVTTTATTTWLMVGFGAYSGSANTNITVNDIMVTEAETTSTYTPYKEATMPIPAEVRALEGYGWSAGSVYNYIDFERKVFVQNVGRVDLGTLTYTNNGVQNNSEEFICANNAISDRAFSKNLVCAKFVNLVGIDTISINTMRGRTNSNRITFYWTLGETASNFKSYVDGVYLYYELATPVETDISQYLTDNLIEVGAGGTLTFPNANGDDYHIPVPSEVTYMIDLQEAVANG